MIKIDNKELKFTKKNLREYCSKIFNVAPFIFDGALFTLEDNDEITINDAKSKISNWLKEEVK